MSSCRVTLIRVAADDVASPAEDVVVAGASAAVRALQGEGDRRAQGEHLRRREERRGAPSARASLAALARPRRHGAQALQAERD